MLAYTASTWTQVIVAVSIFVPVAVTIALCFVFLRGSRNDPDAQRMRRAQQEHERAKRAG